MRMRSAAWASATLLVLTCSSSAAAQTGTGSPTPTPTSPPGTTTIEGLSLSQTLVQLNRPLGVAPIGEALALATSLEVGTAPLGALSAGFVFKVDPTTGLKVRRSTTFGPSFAERALTSGEGKVNVGARIISATYDRLGDLNVKQMQLGSVSARSPVFTQSGISSLVLASDTLVLSGLIGITDNIDLGVAVPLVKTRVNGISWVRNANGDTVTTAKGMGTSSGVGDISVIAKYRFLTFGSGEPDPGGLAGVAEVHLPTGDADNLRGLGVTRTLVGLVASVGQGRIRPHANGGFEAWSKGVSTISDFGTVPTTVTARHQVQYVAGVEVEAAPKLTVLADVLGRHILGGGRVGFRTDQAPAGNALGATSFTSLVALPERIDKVAVVPGLKLNLKGNLLLSLSGIVSIYDNGLHDRFTPVAGLDMTF